MKRRGIVAVVTVIMLICMVIMADASGAYTDIGGHWAEEAIRTWSGYGVVQGDNGVFRPDAPMTRGELAAILSHTLGLVGEGTENPFSDAPEGAWYTPHLLRCYQAGLMNGYQGRARPTDLVNRQEAMVMLARALAIPEQSTGGSLSQFKDGNTVADWAAGYAAALIERGIVSGVDSSHISPAAQITRASVVKILDRAVIQYIHTPGQYTLVDGEGLVIVAAGGVTLTGKTAADLLVTPAADGSRLTFDGAAVSGRITVQASDAKVLVNDSTVTAPILVGERASVETSDTHKPVPTKSPSGGSGSPGGNGTSGGGSGGNSGDSGSSDTGGNGSGGGGDGGDTQPTDLMLTESKTVERGTFQNIKITAAVGNGTVVLKGVTILGDVVVQGGGSHSVKLIGCSIAGQVIMEKAPGQAAETPRLELTDTPLKHIEVRQPAIIEAADGQSAIVAITASADVELRGANAQVEAITVPVQVPPVAVKVVEGSVERIEARSPTTVMGNVAILVARHDVTVASGTVGTVEIPAEAAALDQKVAIQVAQGGTVGEIRVKSSQGAQVSGSGAIGNVFADSEEIMEKIEAPEHVEVSTHSHVWDAGTVSQQPSCAGSGEKVFYCTVAGCSKTRTEAIPIPEEGIAHTWGDWITNDTNHKRICEICGYEETGAHSWDAGQVTKEPTATEPGIRQFTCQVCSTTKEEAIPAEEPTGHTWGEWTVDRESHTRECTICHATETAEHTGAWIKEDTTHTYRCEICSYEETGAHSWDAGQVTKEPTATEPGIRQFTCQVCSTTKEEAIPAEEPTGHTWGEWTVDRESHTRECTICHATETAEHTWGEWTVDGESHTRECTICHTTETAEHTWGDWAAAEKSHTRECTICHATESAEHPGAWIKEDTTHTYRCEICSYEKTGAHSWDAGQVTKEPTATEPGIRQFTCQVCSATREEAIPATGGTLTATGTIVPGRFQITLSEKAAFYDSTGNEIEIIDDLGNYLAVYRDSGNTPFANNYKVDFDGIKLKGTSNVYDQTYGEGDYVLHLERGVSIGVKGKPELKLEGDIPLVYKGPQARGAYAEYHMDEHTLTFMIDAYDSTGDSTPDFDFTKMSVMAAPEGAGMEAGNQAALSAYELGDSGLAGTYSMILNRRGESELQPSAWLVTLRLTQQDQGLFSEVQEGVEYTLLGGPGFTSGASGELVRFQQIVPFRYLTVVNELEKAISGTATSIRHSAYTTRVSIAKREGEQRISIQTCSDQITFTYLGKSATVEINWDKPSINITEDLFPAG